MDKLLAEAESELDRARGGTGAVKREHEQEKVGRQDVQMEEAGGGASGGAGALGAAAHESRHEVKEEVI